MVPREPSNSQERPGPPQPCDRPDHAGPQAPLRNTPDKIFSHNPKRKTEYLGEPQSPAGRYVVPFSKLSIHQLRKGRSARLWPECARRRLRAKQLKSSVPIRREPFDRHFPWQRAQLRDPVVARNASRASRNDRCLACPKAVKALSHDGETPVRKRFEINLPNTSPVVILKWRTSVLIGFVPLKAIRGYIQIAKSASSNDPYNVSASTIRFWSIPQTTSLRGTVVLEQRNSSG